MEDSFRVRVDRAFGSLDASSSSSVKSTSSSLSSLWCLTDEEIQRNEWIQDKVTPYNDKDEDLHRLRNPKPYSSFLHGLLAAEPSNSNQDLESDIQELDDEDDNQQPQLSKPDDHSNEEWDIRSSVSMDGTLDKEEEEDAYDKVAVGREEPADQFYMKAVNDYEVDIDSNHELPRSLTDVIRDPRANHMAAKLRLKEDDESARKLGLQVSENNIQESNPRDLFSLIKGSSDMETQHDVSTDSTTHIVFTPKKKSSDGSMKISKVHGYEEYNQKKVVRVSITADDAEDGEVCAMDEDEPEMSINKSSSLQKTGRRYRTKNNAQLE